MSATVPDLTEHAPLRHETGVEAACAGAAEVAIRRRDCDRARQQARESGDTDVLAHATLALGYASADVQRGARYLVPVAAPIAPARQPGARRRTPAGSGRPRVRRAARSAATRGDPGDDGEPSEPEPPLAAAAPGRSTR